MEVTVDNSKLTNRTNFIIFIVVVIGFVGVLNYVLSKAFIRADLTANKVYTISKATKKLLKDLDDRVTIKVFISEKNLPPLAVNMTRTIKDLLSEYEAYSRGNVHIEYFDPTDDQEVKNQARSLGLQEVPMQIIQKDKQENVMCFMGLAILYAEKKETMPVLNNVGNLEYDLTSRILKVTRTEVKKVAFYFGNGPHMFIPEEMQQQQQQRGPAQSYNQIRNSLQEQFEVRDAGALSKGEKVPDDVTTLVVAGPRSLDKREKFEIDQFVMRGGRLIALIDAVEVQTQYGLNASKQAHNSGDLFNHYGAKVNQNLVADLKAHTNITYQVNYGGFMLPISRPYPLWIEVTRNGFDKDCPAVSGLENMIFMWTGSVESTLPKADSAKKVTALPLIRTTPFAMEMADAYDLNPQREWNTVKKEDLKTFNLAVLMSGEFNSFYAGKPIPPVSGPDTAAAARAAAADANRAVLSQSPKTHIVLIADSDFLSDGTPRENNLFMTNLTEWFTLGDNLISIRSKSITDRSINPGLSEGTKSSIRLFNMIGMPLLVIVLGVAVSLRRRKLAKKGA